MAQHDMTHDTDAQPPATDDRRSRRRIAYATLAAVGVLGLAGVGFALTRGGDEPKAPQTPQPAMVSVGPAAGPAPTDPAPNDDDPGLSCTGADDESSPECSDDWGPETGGGAAPGAPAGAGAAPGAEVGVLPPAQQTAPTAAPAPSASAGGACPNPSSLVCPPAATGKPGPAVTTPRAR